MGDRRAMAQLRTLFFAVLLLGAGAGCSEAHTMEGTDAGRFLPVDGWSSDEGLCAPSGCFPDSPPPPPVDAGPASCEADDARPEVCPDAICDGPDSYAWDGERCIRIDCGTCEGTDCSGLTHSLAECQALHSTCVPQLCRATGGEWLFFTEECEHYVCGFPQPATCLVGQPVCNC